MRVQGLICALLQDAALQLAYGEYGLLKPVERVAILRSLVHLLLGTEAIRDAIQVQTEAAAPSRAKAAQVRCHQESRVLQCMCN